MYVIDKTSRFLEFPPPSFFLNFLEHFYFVGGGGGVFRLVFTAIIYSLNKASRIHSTTVKHSFGSRGTFPNLVFVVRHEVRSHEFMHE